MSGEPICGLWVDDDGRAWVCTAQPDGSRREREEPLRPFAWLSAAEPAEGITIESLVDVFKDVEESIYVDICCHVNPHGNDLMVDAMVAAIDKHWGTGKSQVQVH